MYKLIQEDSLFILTHVSFKIIKSRAYYSFRAKLVRDYTVKVVKSLKGKLTYLDGFCSTGIMGIKLLKEACVQSVIFNDLHTPAGLILHNLLLNKLYNTKFTIFNKNVLKLIEKLTNIDIIDLDPYGSPLPYLFNLKRINSSYLFITHTDLINICSHSCKKYYSKYNVIQYYCEAYNECAIRSIVYISNMNCYNSLQLFDFYTVNGYFRLYLKVLDKQGISFFTGFICICGAFYSEQHRCVVCRHSTKFIFPVMYCKLLGDQIYKPFGFNKRQYSRVRKIPVPKTSDIVELLFKYGIHSVQSSFDTAIIKVSKSIVEVVNILDLTFQVNNSIK